MTRVPLLAACAILTAACSAAPATAPALTLTHPVGPDVSASIVKVTDGDTFHVSTPTGQEAVRVLGFNSPEVVDPRKPVECGGPEASAWAKQLLTNQHVTLVSDPTQADRDRYQRLLRYVRLDDGRDYSIEAARAGMGRDYVYGRKPVQEQAQIVAAETEARAAKRGLWAHCVD